ncbi:MAG: glycosyltransferase [Calditrichaceae bacterium]
MDKRCLIVSYYFAPLGGGGVQRILKFIKYLSRYDWSITVVTAGEQMESVPSDHSLLREVPPEVKIIRVLNNLPVIEKRFLKNLPFLKDASYWKRWLSAFYYIPDMRKEWIAPAKNAILNEINQKSYDCILITAPPYSLAILAAELTHEVSLPVILDMRDPWTMNPYKIHPTAFHFKKDYKYEFDSISLVQYGAAAYKSLVDNYQKTIKGFNSAKWVIIPNGFDEDDFEALSPVKLDDGYLNIAFSGTFYSHINNPENLFKAIALVEKKYPEKVSKIRFHHIGKSMISLSALAKKYGIEANIREWGYLEHKDCLDLLSGMDVCCFILDDKYSKSDMTIGGKVYEYLRLGKPILALVPETGEAADLINQTNSGRVIPPSRISELAQVLAEWTDSIPKFKFNDIDKYSRKNLTDTFHHFLERIISV